MPQPSGAAASALLVDQDRVLWPVCFTKREAKAYQTAGPFDQAGLQTGLALSILVRAALQVVGNGSGGSDGVGRDLLAGVLVAPRVHGDVIGNRPHLAGPAR
jgi:hypothetical protein